MLADHAYAIGSSHDVCEDYASSALDADLQAGHGYAVTTDGCSICLDAEGNPDPESRTDVGASLLNLAACDLLRRPIHDAMGLHHLILAKAALSIGTCGLRPNSLAATLLLLQSSTQEHRVTICGDGVVAARSVDDSNRWFVSEFDFTKADKGEPEKGPPYYLFYELNQRDRDRYFERDAQFLQVKSYDLDVELGNTGNSGVEYIPLGKQWPFFYSMFFPKTLYDMVLLFSDGVQSYQQGGGRKATPITTPLALCPFLSLPKKVGGRFLFKRLRKVEKANRASADNVNHFDDVSVSGVFSGG